MVFHHYVESVISIIDKYFKINPSYIGEPDIYFRYKLNKMRLENGVWAYTNIPKRYVK